MDDLGSSGWEERYREAEERCRGLSMQIERFQQQAGRVRELLTSKLQDMESHISAWRGRAEQADEQVKELEDKLEIARNELRSARDQIDLLEQCCRDKDNTMVDLERRLLEESQQHGRVVNGFESKMAKIKDWVASKLQGLEGELMLYRAKETEAVRLIGLLDKAEGGNNGEAYFQLVSSLQGLFTPEDMNNSQVSPKMRFRSYSVGSSSHKPCSPQLSRHQERIKDKAPPPLPLKQSKSTSSVSVSHRQETEPIPVRSPRQAYVQLDLSDPSRIIVSDLTTIETPGFLSPTKRDDYIAFDPRNPLQLLGSVEEHSEDNPPAIVGPTQRPPLFSNDTFYSTFSTMDDSSYDPDMSISPLEFEGTESIYEIPIEQLLRKKQLEQQAEQQKKLEANSDAPPLPERSSTRIERFRMESLAIPHSRSQSPPPLPKHRHPSWVSRIYNVAATSIQTSPAPVSQCTLEPVKFTTLSRKGSNIYKNMDKSAPVFATLKGHAAQLRGTPFTGESTDSSDHETDQPLFSPPPVSDRISSGDYEVPPDAHELNKAAATVRLPDQQGQPQLSEELLRTHSLSRDELEKSGYLTKLGTKVKNWKRYWFVLSANKLTYYRTPSEVGRKKPRGVIELNSFCRLSQSEGAHTFQIATDKRTYYLTAETASTLQQWLKVLQNVLQKSVTRPRAVDKSPDKVLVKGWLTKVKRGRAKKCWCLLTATVLSYYKKQSDKSPIGQIDLKGCTVLDADEIQDSGSDTEDNMSVSSKQTPSDFAIQVESNVAGTMYFIMSSRQEKDIWLYHLSVASGLSQTRTGTETEKLIASLMRVDGSPESRFWNHSILCHSKDAITKPLTSLPYPSLEVEAVQMFKSIQLFTTISINFSAIEYHINLAQAAISGCVAKQELQSELYCQLIRQTNQHPEPDSSEAIQCWMLLALCCPIFLPQQKYLWYFKHYLQRHASMRPIAVRYAVYCQRCVERAEVNGPRESRPSRMEVLSVLLGDAVKHASPLSIPVHLPSQRYQVVSFDGSTLVKELNGRLSQELGMRDPLVTGFALLTDDPLMPDVEHCLEPDVKVCDAISLWELTARDGNQGKVDPSKTIKIMFKNRLYFKNMVRGETERERLLILYQALETIINGHFPINKDLAIELGALMLQIEFGDHHPVGGSIGIAQEIYVRVEHALAKFLPSKMIKDLTFEERRQISSQLTEKWAALRGRQPADCARVYLNVCRRWPFFGARLFPCKRKSDYVQVWLAVQEDSISTLDLSTLRLVHRYPYESVVTFGGHKDDFMVVVKQSSALAFSPHQLQLGTEKLLFAMRPGLVTEVTNLIASYINAIKVRQSFGYAPEPASQTASSTEALPRHQAVPKQHATNAHQFASAYELGWNHPSESDSLGMRRWERKVELNVALPSSQVNGQVPDATSGVN